MWFDIADYVIDALRANGDNHVIFINFAPWARYAGFMSRKLVDTNVVYCPHFYQGIDTESLAVEYNDYAQLESDFEQDVNVSMSIFNVPFVMEEQGFGGGNKAEMGNVFDTWLRNAVTVHKTNPLMQGWLYWCYVAYGGTILEGGWQTTLSECVADKLTYFHS